MGAERYTLDTNIFFYSLDGRTPEKHRLAQRLTAGADPLRVPIMLQALGELCNSIAKRQPLLLPKARSTVNAASRFFDIVPANVSDIESALQAHQQHGLQFWDAMLWATASRAGCTLFLSEDLQDGRRLGNIVFRNPFRMTNEALETLLG